MFNRFWRADPSRVRHSGGTGLGLAISHEDALLHGGSLSAVGKPGVGSCFRLTLPITPNQRYEEDPLPLALPSQILDEDTVEYDVRAEFEADDDGVVANWAELIEQNVTRSKHRLDDVGPKDPIYPISGGNSGNPGRHRGETP